MVIRSISDLKQLEGNFNSADLFQISRKQDENKYASQKISYGKLEQSILDKTILSVGEKWQMDENNIQKIRNDVNSLQSAIDIKEDGDQKNYAFFKNIPTVEYKKEGDYLEDTQIPNKKQVIDLVYDYSEYVSENSFINTIPNNDQGYTEYDEENTYIWNIDSGLRDSSKSEYKYGKGKNGPNGGSVISENGILNIYGWLTAPQDVTAQEAWVGLYGRVKVQDQSTKWVLLQVQPWIVGKYSNVMQYVGFQLPVKSGLELKVMTGFMVDGTSSGNQTGNTLMFKNIGNTVNMLVGYVLRND